MLLEDELGQALRKSAIKAVNIKESEIGIVTSINPLQINVGGLILTMKNLYINYDLLEHTENFKTLTGTIGDSTTNISNGSILFETKLKQGDKVIARELKNNKYYIACKVVGGE